MVNSYTDEMNGLLVSNPESIAETKIVSSINNWFVSYQNSNPNLGAFQDSIIGSAVFTESDMVNIDKYHAMRMCARTFLDTPVVFDKAKYTSHEIITKFLPKVNYEGKAKYYVPDFAGIIDYNEKDINVKIKRGVFEHGVLDAATIGQGAVGGLFHTIASEFGPSVSIETIYNLQQIANNSLYHTGVTFGFADTYVSHKLRKVLKGLSDKIITASYDVTKKLDEGKLIPPVDMTIGEYYEELQTIALETDDEFIRAIIQEIDVKKNWLYKFVMSGSKGDRTNLASIYALIGSIGLKGGRIPMQLNGRTSINFQRFSTNPISRGLCLDSFSTGICAATFPFAAFEARYELIEIALSTATAGAMSRNAIKNLESIIVGNSRGSIKRNRTVQLLFGETGIDTRKVRLVQFPTIKLSDSEFKSYHTKTSQLAKIYQNKNVQIELDNEFETLSNDRDLFRHIMLTLEAHQRRNFLLKDTLRMPIDVNREIINVLEINAAVEDKKSAVSKKSSKPFDPIKAIVVVREYTKGVGYIYQNEIRRKAKSVIPHHIENAVTFMKILIRSYLCTSNLIRHKISNDMLDDILTEVTVKISNCFMDYGTSVGIIAAESISEPITQFLLDAKHRSGLKKEKTNMIVRFDEILKNSPTEKLDNPQMVLVPHKEFNDNKQKTMEIANHIEMLPLSRFINRSQLWSEKFGKPVHPTYKHESKMIEKFQAYNLGEQVPTDMVDWCIRFELNREEMILKSMKMKTIYLHLMNKFPYIYVVYHDVVIRIYIRSTAPQFVKKKSITTAAVREIADTIKVTIVRGIEGISTANVIEIPKTVINDEGGLTVKKFWGIETDGTNLSKILENKFLNKYESNTTSIDEIEKIYGIEAARNKIIDELQTTEKNKANHEWATIYADEMTYGGQVTSIQRGGLSQREVNNVLLRASFGDPIRTFQNAAIDNQTDHIGGMSAPLMLGTVPNFGTTFNDVIIDHESVKLFAQNFQTLIEAI